MATNLKINIIEKTKPQTTYSIPCKIIKLSIDMVPAPVTSMLQEEGISIQEIAKLAAKSELTGTLLTIEHHISGDKIVIELD
jgi:L-serine deaminase